MAYISIAEKLGIVKKPLDKNTERFCLVCATGYVDLVKQLDDKFKYDTNTYNEGLYYCISSNNEELIMYILNKSNNITKGFVEVCNLNLSQYIDPFLKKLISLNDEKNTNLTLKQCFEKLAENDNLELFNILCQGRADNNMDFTDTNEIFIQACKTSPSIIEYHFLPCVENNKFVYIGLQNACIYQQATIFKSILSHIYVQKKELLDFFNYSRDNRDIVDYIIKRMGSDWTENDLRYAESQSVLNMYTTRLLKNIRIRGTQFNKIGASEYHYKLGDNSVVICENTLAMESRCIDGIKNETLALSDA